MGIVVGMKQDGTGCNTCTAMRLTAEIGGSAGWAMCQDCMREKRWDSIEPADPAALLCAIDTWSGDMLDTLGEILGCRRSATIEVCFAEREPIARGFIGRYTGVEPDSAYRERLIDAVCSCRGGVHVLGRDPKTWERCQCGMIRMGTDDGKREPAQRVAKEMNARPETVSEVIDHVQARIAAATCSPEAMRALGFSSRSSMVTAVGIESVEVHDSGTDAWIKPHEVAIVITGNPDPSEVAKDLYFNLPCGIDPLGETTGWYAAEMYEARWFTPEQWKAFAAGRAADEIGDIVTVTTHVTPIGRATFENNLAALCLPDAIAESKFGDRAPYVVGDEVDWRTGPSEHTWTTGRIASIVNDAPQDDAAARRACVLGHPNPPLWIAEIDTAPGRRFVGPVLKACVRKRVATKYDSIQRSIDTRHVSITPRGLELGGVAAPALRPDGFAQSAVDAAKAVLLSTGTKRGGK